jgi:hypothetical protein
MLSRIGRTATALAAVGAFALGGSAIAGAATNDSGSTSTTPGTTGKAAQSQSQPDRPAQGDCPEKDAG